MVIFLRRWRDDNPDPIREEEGDTTMIISSCPSTWCSPIHKLPLSSHVHAFIHSFVPSTLPPTPSLSFLATVLPLSFTAVIHRYPVDCCMLHTIPVNLTIGQAIPTSSPSSSETPGIIMEEGKVLDDCRLIILLPSISSLN